MYIISTSKTLDIIKHAIYKENVAQLLLTSHFCTQTFKKQLSYKNWVEYLAPLFPVVTSYSTKNTFPEWDPYKSALVQTCGLQQDILFISTVFLLPLPPNVEILLEIIATMRKQVAFISVLAENPRWLPTQDSTLETPCCSSPSNCVCADIDFILYKIL